MSSSPKNMREGWDGIRDETWGGLADSMEESLWRDLIHPWFPRCLDPQGGFTQSFSLDWKPLPDELKSVVFQSRMTWLCATLSETGHPDAGRYAEIARHGMDFLRGQMIDASGAVFWAVDARSPQGAAGTYRDQRHTYGAAFALFALAAAHRALGSSEALESAESVFQWLEANAHDPLNGGYFECSDPFGRPLLHPPTGFEKGEDAIGTRFGLKSQNTHLHLLEAFTELARVWPDERLRQRLHETWGILTGPLFHSAGHLHLFATSDWRPVPGPVSYGHDIEAAHLLMDSAQCLFGAIDTVSEDRARRLIDHTLEKGMDVQFGGFYYTGDENGMPTVRTKVWWTQAEALLGLVNGLNLPNADHGRYQDAIRRTWTWICDNQIDPARGGWFENLSETGEVLPPFTKGSPWKAAYHDGRALLFSARALRRVAS